MTTTLGGMTMGFAERVRPGICEGTRGERVALQEVELHATLRDLLCEVRAVQVYRNTEARAIEAVYTFPLPLDAVLLDVHVTLGTRELSGVVVEKRRAEREYEAAVAEGDAAVMLEQAEPGLYTMNVGNLLPGEVARIAVTYALLHRWSGERLRLHFPTTIAPRYGTLPLQPHQQPEHSLMVEHHFAFSLTVEGALAEATFTSPSHALVQSRRDDALVLALRQERAAMDRDVVVELRASHVDRSVLLTGDDGEGTAAIASFQPRLGGLQQERALSLVLVVDCSGSMEGDSIAQASQALREVVSQLQPGDRVGIVRFGNHAERMRPRLAPCTPAVLEQAAAYCMALRADMGGTEIGAALSEAHDLLRGTEGGEVFLITDGQVGEWASVVAHARATGIRHFTVGVGSAVTEAFVRQLAEATKGASELVAPNEGMAPRIVRHFERMRAPRAKSVRVTWPAGAEEVTPASFGAVFAGDTVVASARFASRLPAGEVVLEVEDAAGGVTRQLLQLPGATHQAVARLAAAQRLPSLTPEAATAQAVRYRLASPFTNWLVIAPRAEGEKADGMPALRKVPQVMAAGWGGMGSVHASAMPNLYSPMPARFSREMAPMSDVADFRVAPSAAPSPDREVSYPLDRLVDRMRRIFSGGRRMREVVHDWRTPLAAVIEADPSSLAGAGVLGRLHEFLDAIVGGDVAGAWLSEIMHLTDFAGVSRATIPTVLMAAIVERASLTSLSPEGARAVDALVARAHAERATLLAQAPEVVRAIERLCDTLTAS